MPHPQQSRGDVVLVHKVYLGEPVAVEVAGEHFVGIEHHVLW